MSNLDEVLQGIEAGHFGSCRGWEASASLINKGLEQAKGMGLAVWSETLGRVVLTPAGLSRSFRK